MLKPPTSTIHIHIRPQQPIMTTPAPPSYRAIIFDMGEVLFSWTPTDHPSVPLPTLIQMTRDPLWQTYERGEISPEKCTQQLSENFIINASSISDAFRAATAALEPNDEMTDLVRDIKRLHPNTIKVVMMTNIPRPDFDELRERAYIWESFDGGVFASCCEGMRKPEERFYRRVLERVGVEEPSGAIFVDDRLENVTAARELGMSAVHCKDVGKACRDVREMLGI